MKIFLLILFGFSGFAQKAVYNKITKAGNFTEYETKKGDLIKTGDTITIGYPIYTDFKFLTQGDFQISAALSNSKIIISKIKTTGNNNIGYKTYLYFKGIGSNCKIDYEAALETGEIKK